jgi:hypothetical protein
LLLRLPGVAQRQVDHLVGLVDLFPTIAEAIGHELPATLDGRSLLPTIHENRPAGDEYYIENFSYQQDDYEPHVVSRAIRCADGRKYVWNGVPVGWNEIDAMAPADFETYVSRVTYGNPPSDWFRGRVRTLVQQQGRKGALRTMLSGCRPRHLLFDNVDMDLTETQPTPVDEQHPRWAEYCQYRDKMQQFTATPRLAQNISAEDEAQLKQRLCELGYV